VQFWAVDENAVCPRPAGLQFRQRHELQLISATPLREEDCKWSFKDVADHPAVEHVIMTLTPVYIIRELRFIDQDKNPGKRITGSALHQKFVAEVEFEIPPPAPIYIELGSKKVVVRATGDPTVFSSEVTTRAALLGIPSP
jgi:hypothetical protein